MIHKAADCYELWTVIKANAGPFAANFIRVGDSANELHAYARDPEQGWMFMEESK